ncbi:MAG: deoxyribodipyrimidine photo-lyase, partial [Burkholderiaceae bacterium]
MGVQAVWFKRDLRTLDHAPLFNAAQQGPVLCFYVLEPALWQQPDSARQHYHFVLESLRDLYKALRVHGVRLHILVGDVTRV